MVRHILPALVVATDEPQGDAAKNCIFFLEQCGKTFGSTETTGGYKLLTGIRVYFRVTVSILRPIHCFSMRSRMPNGLFKM